MSKGQNHIEEFIFMSPDHYFWIRRPRIWSSTKFQVQQPISYFYCLSVCMLGRDFFLVSMISHGRDVMATGSRVMTSHAKGGLKSFIMTSWQRGWQFMAKGLGKGAGNGT